MDWGSLFAKGAGALKKVATSKGARKIGGKLLGNADAILGGVGMLQGGMQVNTAQRMEMDALARAQQLFDEKAPLRKLSASLLQQRPRRDLSALTPDDGNPFARRGGGGSV